MPGILKWSGTLGAFFKTEEGRKKYKKSGYGGTAWDKPKPGLKNKVEDRTQYDKAGKDWQK